jgi:hypothetical protein
LHSLSPSDNALIDPTITFSNRPTDTRKDLDEAPMDLTPAISGMQQAQTLSAVQVSVAAKVMDMQRLEGNAAVQLIQAAGQSASGDVMVAAATGVGGQIDTYA